MALETLKCTRCEETFTAGKWTCADGSKHELAAKTYYSPMPALRMYVSEERMDTLEDGRRRMTPARSIEFVAGRFTTADAEDQYSLDHKAKIGSLITKEQWEERYYSKEDRLKEREKNLAERESRLAKQENSLLDQQKAQRGVKA